MSRNAFAQCERDYNEAIEQREHAAYERKSMRTITATLPAFLTNDWTSPEELLTGDPERIAGMLSYYAKNISPDRWVQVGTAKIEITLIDERELVDNKAEQLRAEIQKTKADSQVRVTLLEEKLQSLLAISYKPEVVG